jgi:anti-anti-sigma factor
MHGRRVEVDLTGITFIDSVGLRGVLQAFDQIAAAGGAASITAASPGARRVFELSGLGAMLA